MDPLAEQDLVIFGTGGFAREVLQIVEDNKASTPNLRMVGFLDDNPEKHGQEVHGYPVLGGSDWLQGRPGTAVVVAVGSPAAKRRIVERLQGMGCKDFPEIIHHQAWIGSNVKVGQGCIICARACITTDITFGEFVIVNLAVTVGHDCRIEDYVTISPGASISGNVTVGEGADVGTGAALIQGVSVGPWSVVGAGAVVIRDVPANSTAVGNPAKVIKERPDRWHLHE